MIKKDGSAIFFDISFLSNFFANRENKGQKLSRKYSKFSVLAYYGRAFVSYVWTIGNKSIHIPIHCAYMSPEMLHKKEINMVHKIKIKYQN